MLVGWTKTSEVYDTPCSCEADFIHTDGNGNDVECHFLDHYARHCPNPPFSRLLAESIYSDVLRGEIRYGKINNELSVTMLTKDPLLLWLEQTQTYVEDPLGRRFMLRGTFAHEGILRRCKGPMYTIEQALRLPMTGAYLYGTVDVVEHNPPEYTIRDLKTQDIFAIDRKIKSTPDKVREDKYVKDNIFQLNAYRVMLHDVLGITSQRGILEYWDGQLRVYSIDCPFIDIDDMRTIMQERVDGILNSLKSDNPPAPDPKNTSGRPHISITKSGVYHKWLENK